MTSNGSGNTLWKVCMSIAEHHAQIILMIIKGASSIYRGQISEAYIHRHATIVAWVIRGKQCHTFSQRDSWVICSFRRHSQVLTKDNGGILWLYEERSKWTIAQQGGPLGMIVTALTLIFFFEDLKDLMQYCFLISLGLLSRLPNIHTNLISGEWFSISFNNICYALVCFDQVITHLFRERNSKDVWPVCGAGTKFGA